ncbi:MAG: DUF6600 domain-containing protein [Candidatus Acidiferrum sp.]
MKMKRHALHFMSLLGLALALAFLVLPRAAARDDDDPPGRVARLSFVRGTVSFEPAGTEDWVSAVVNRPLTTGDKLWNDNDSFSELDLGSAAIRVGSNTGLSFLDLTDTMAQVSLTEGTLNIRVRRLADDESFEVDTPNLAFTLLRSGNYKVTVNESGDATVVLVRQGTGEVTGGGSAYTVHPGEVGTFTGTDQIDGEVQSWDNTSDDFDDWCAERESRADHSVSEQYVSDDVIGYEDLDEYGGWRSVPEYGHVWFPHTTTVGWAPYHSGHWAYIAPWGYTWVDNEPWGFAPFHYGRWVVVGGAWGWVPAPPRSAYADAEYVRPVYAPALVAWVGGAHFGIGVAVGGASDVGWFALGPREVYVPSYHVSRRYMTNINVTNTRVTSVVVNNYYETHVVNRSVTTVTYVNQRVPGAVMATTSVAFTSGQPVSRHAVRMNEREVASARIGYGAPAVAPSRQAVLGAGVTVRVRPRLAMENRVVVVRHAPPPPPLSFARQREAIQANGGRPLAISQTREIRAERDQPRTNVRIAPAATPRNFRDNRAVPPNGNRGYQPNANRDVQPNQNRPLTPRNPANNSGNPPVTGTHERIYTDRPQNARPTRPANVPNEPVASPQPDTFRKPSPNPDRSVVPNANRPEAPANRGNNPGNPPAAGTQERINNDRPRNARPTPPPVAPNQPDVNPRIEQRRQPEPQNPRTKPPATIRRVTPPNDTANPKPVRPPQTEPRNPPPPQNPRVQQNQERRTFEPPKPQPKQQGEKKKEQKPAKPPKEEKPPKSIR